MKITFIYDRCCLGGSESAVKNRMDYLIMKNIDCQAIFMHEGIQNQTFKNHKVYIAESDYKIKLLTADSDIIDVISPLSSTFRKMYKLNKPIIHECHCSSFFSYLSYLNPDFVKAITFPSKCDMNAAQKYIRSNIPCYIVYNCLGNDFLNKDMYESKYNNKKIILWVGRIEHNKNWRMLIEIAKLLKSSYIIRVVTNSSVSMEYFKFIKEISRNNLNNKFEIINDCPYSSMKNHYIDASLNGCYLSTSLSESFGMTLLESMYCKCPMVLSNLPYFMRLRKTVHSILKTMIQKNVFYRLKKFVMI